MAPYRREEGKGSRKFLGLEEGGGGPLMSGFNHDSNFKPVHSTGAGQSWYRCQPVRSSHGIAVSRRQLVRRDRTKLVQVVNSPPTKPHSIQDDLSAVLSAVAASAGEDRRRLPS